MNLHDLSSHAQAGRIEVAGLPAAHIEADRLMGLGFGWSADHAAGYGGSYRKTGSQFSASRLFVTLGLFRAFDHVAVGITLTLTTVAATTLAARATTWAIAFGVLRTVFRQLLFVGVHFFFSDGSSGLFGAWLTLFTRLARLALFTGFAWFTGGAFFTRLTLFARLALFVATATTTTATTTAAITSTRPAWRQSVSSRIWRA